MEITVLSPHGLPTAGKAHRVLSKLSSEPGDLAEQTGQHRVMSSLTGESEA